MMELSKITPQNLNDQDGDAKVLKGWQQRAGLATVQNKEGRTVWNYCTMTITFTYDDGRGSREGGGWEERRLPGVEVM